MSSLSKALIHVEHQTNQMHERALSLKKAGQLPDILSMGVNGSSMFSQYQDQGATQRRYAQYRGWVYSAIHALATEAAKQPVMVGKLAKDKGEPATTKDGHYTRRLKAFERAKMPTGIRHKAAADELEVITNHSLVDLLERPNRIQYKMQFVYSFVANLCLTGWSYIVAGQNEEGDLEFYSLPTSWVVPDHSQGAFQQFRIVNPRNAAAGANQPPLDRSQVAFAHLPNPSDPLSALAPAQAQNLAIKIDDHIQSSQAMFFENGLFPSAIVTIGKNPHPDVPGGVRPRLSPAQRRQVYGAIKKVMGGVANYGNPAILDGMIESIERLSSTQNEMGWEKSEKATRTRILSAFGVHPFILGEEMAGSYAQAFIVQDRFCQRVNLFLDMLSTIMTDFAPPLISDKKEKTTLILNKAEAGLKTKPKGTGKLLVWWEEATAKDQQREQSMWDGARGRGDVSQNEYRSYMNLPPDEDKNEACLDKSSVQPIAAMAAQVKSGALTPEQGLSILIGMGLPDDLAKKIAGPGPTEEDKAKAEALQQMGGGPPGAGGPPKPGQEKPNNNPSRQVDAPPPGAPKPSGDYSDYEKAIQAADEAVHSLKSVDGILREAKGLLVL